MFCFPRILIAPSTCFLLLLVPAFLNLLYIIPAFLFSPCIFIHFFIVLFILHLLSTDVTLPQFLAFHHQYTFYFFFAVKLNRAVTELTSGIITSFSQNLNLIKMSFSHNSKILLGRSGLYFKICVYLLKFTNGDMVFYAQSSAVTFISLRKHSSLA